MMNVRPILICVAAFMAMISCGGGAAEKGDLNRTRPPVAFASLEAEATQLHATWDAVSFSDPATLPMSGRAQYNGVIQMDVQQGALRTVMNGDLQLNANFANEKVSGRANSFVDPSDNAYSGSLDVTNSVMDRGADPTTGFTYQTDLTGRLTGNGQTIDVDAGLSGDFRGTQPDATSGIVQGTVSGTGGAGFVYGDYIAED